MSVQVNQYSQIAKEARKDTEKHAALCAWLNARTGVHLSTAKRAAVLLMLTFALAGALFLYFTSFPV